MACQVRTEQTKHHVYTLISYFSPAATLRELGAGTGPILLNNVSCNHSHLKLSQCIRPEQIGLHNCARNQAVGVICHKVFSYNMYLTSTHPPMTSTPGPQTTSSTVTRFNNHTTPSIQQEEKSSGKASNMFSTASPPMVSL